MNHTWLLILTALAGLCGCGRGSDPTIVQTAGKIDGPNVKTLSHDQLMDVLHECHRYGASDDPKVKYTIGYCSAAQSAHAMEGYASPSSAAVDPTLTKMH
jgi:hypothetical protein